MALVCVMPVIFWVRAQVRSGHGQVDVGKKKIRVGRSCLSDQCCVCVSEHISLEPELGLAELGLFWQGKVKAPLFGD